ncbi:MAG: hypothetical protein IPN47_10590 [Gemmatimonadetes bacterium]|nr:hypothetical protein [Gemmatimonadota bacterium]
MTPDQILRELRDQTYVMLRPSPIEGIGVFAIRDIPKGCRDMFSPPGAPDEYLAVPRAEIDALPAHARSAWSRPIASSTLTGTGSPAMASSEWTSPTS